MPDFTYEYYEECDSLLETTANVGGYLQTGLNDERQYPQCSCPAYKFGKRTVNFGGRMFPAFCKHIIDAEKQYCGWSSFYSDEHQDVSGTCPKCGKSTHISVYAV